MPAWFDASPSEVAAQLAERRLGSGQALTKQANPLGQLLQRAGAGAQQGVSAIRDWVAKNPQSAPLILSALAGAGGGGLLGAASNIGRDPEDRHTVRDAFSGALAGGAMGLGAQMALPFFTGGRGPVEYALGAGGGADAGKQLQELLKRHKLPGPDAGGSSPQPGLFSSSAEKSLLADPEFQRLLETNPELAYKAQQAIDSQPQLGRAASGLADSALDAGRNFVQDHPLTSATAATHGAGMMARRWADQKHQLTGQGSAGTHPSQLDAGFRNIQAFNASAGKGGRSPRIWERNYWQNIAPEQVEAAKRLQELQTASLQDRIGALQAASQGHSYNLGVGNEVRSLSPNDIRNVTQAGGHRTDTLESLRQLRGKPKQRGLYDPIMSGASGYAVLPPKTPGARSQTVPLPGMRNRLLRLGQRSPTARRAGTALMYAAPLALETAFPEASKNLPGAIGDTAGTLLSKIPGVAGLLGGSAQ